MTCRLLVWKESKAPPIQWEKTGAGVNASPLGSINGHGQRIKAVKTQLRKTKGTKTESEKEICRGTFDALHLKNWRLME